MLTGSLQESLPCWPSSWTSSASEGSCWESSAASSFADDLHRSSTSLFSSCSSSLYEESEWQAELACWERGFGTSLGDACALSARDLFHLLPMQA